MSEADVLDDPAPPATPRHRMRWGCLIVVLVLFTACGGFYGILTYKFRSDLNETMAELDRKEPDGWTIDKIEEHRKKVPDDENAALVVQSLKSKLPVNWPPPRKPPGDEAEAPPAPVVAGEQRWVAGDVRDLPPPVQIDDALLRNLRDDLKAVRDNGDALDDAHKLRKLRDGRFPIKYSKDFISTLINSQDSRAGANLLQHEAYLLAQEGKIDEALADVRGIIICGRAIGDEPLIISQLIRMAMQAMAVGTLERVLAQVEPSPDELRKTQELLELEAGEPILVIAARGERAGEHELMMGLKSGNAKLSALTGGGNSGLANLAGASLARGSHPRLLRMMTDFVEAAKLPPEQQGEAFKQLDVRAKQAKVNYDVVIALLVPATMKVSEAYRRNQAGLRCATVAVAAERYRRDNGRWPQGIDELTDKYLKAVPTDPYDGKPLRYKRLEDGVIVYSVGPDLVDNGGVRNRNNPLAKGTDYGFRLWDAAARRQPAAEVLPLPQEDFVPPGND